MPQYDLYLKIYQRAYVRYIIDLNRELDLHLEVELGLDSNAILKIIKPL